MLRTSNDFALRRASLALGCSVLLTIAFSVPARALLRSPQVPVNGTALQSFFNAQGQSISAASDQQQPAGFTGLFLTQPATHFAVYAFGKHQDDLVVYLTSSPSSPLYVISPAGAASGWFTEVSFRDAPVRMVVTLFDATSTFQGATTYLGLGLNFMGLATSGPAAMGSWPTRLRYWASSNPPWRWDSKRCGCWNKA